MTKDLNLKNFRMPGEWEPQKSVWIAWPYNKKDWPGMFKNIPKTIAEIITNLSLNQKVNLLINKRKDKIKLLLIGIEKKLANQNFIDNAPKDVVKREKIKMDELTDELTKINSNLEMFI